MYKQLTSKERHYIAIQLKRRISKNNIAKQLGVVILRSLERLLVILVSAVIDTIAQVYPIVLILKRPWAVNKRLIFGHWEADTIIGKARQGAIVTLDERVTKLKLADPVESRHMSNVPATIIRLLKPLGHVVDSITYDNGKEFAAYQKVNNSIGCMSYFATPYHSWEHGQNGPLKGE